MNFNYVIEKKEKKLKNLLIFFVVLCFIQIFFLELMTYLTKCF